MFICHHQTHLRLLFIPVYIYINIYTSRARRGYKTFRSFAHSSSLVLHPFHSTLRTRNKFRMKSLTLFLVSAMLVSIAWSFPQKDGQVFSNEAIRQAQNTYLIPKDATIQKVQEGIELAAYESIPGDEKINLFEILGDQVPPEVVSNLQGQIDQIGRS